jgi:type IV fimbrial biogenesis protein FimT
MRAMGQPGFTLVELMVVVTIVGVLAMVGLPEMNNMIKSSRIKSASLDIYSSLALARSEAVKRNAANISMVAATGGWQNGWTVCVDVDVNGACGAGDVMLLTGEAIHSTITVSGPAGNIVTFGRDGRPNTGSAAFTLRAGTNNVAAPMRCIDLDVSGRPRTRMDTNHTDSDGCN